MRTNTTRLGRALCAFAIFTLAHGAAACGGVLDDAELAGLDGEEQEDERTRAEALTNISVSWDSTTERFSVFIEGPRDAVVKVCVKDVDVWGNPCDQTEDFFQLGQGAEGFDWWGAGTFWNPNRVRQRIFFTPDSLGWPTCDTTYEFRIKDRSEFWYTTKHLSTSTSQCPDGGTLRPAQGGYPAACVLGETTVPSSHGFIYNGWYYYTPVWGVAGSPCPDSRGVFDTVNCRMAPPFPAVPQNRQGLVIWPASYAYEAVCLP